MPVDTAKNLLSVRFARFQSKEENQQQTQPAYGINIRIKTQATLVRGNNIVLTTAPSIASLVHTYICFDILGSVCIQKSVASLFEWTTCWTCMSNHDCSAVTTQGVLYQKKDKALLH